ncbi:MAG: type II toxin-antitoxin system RelE/ParE family toxin [Deltaproteobacteria bacterium]|jgi:plasmid stabilization system protein ParE|nr:type II toxin-antitoxin system RelE/ParE family toxin [Deltaproteobacteria bacterium]MBT4526303.1 type II toxin-antitoxin system RelE/ParE family toxin [Deltaproteobacteria bacterium]
MKIIYTPEAVDDLLRLREFIEIKNPKAASRIATSLQIGIKKLKTFPNLGADVKEDESGLIKDLILGDYIVRYLPLKEVIHILRIWHHKEDWKKT